MSRSLRYRQVVRAGHRASPAGVVRTVEKCGFHGGLFLQRGACHSETRQAADHRGKPCVTPARRASSSWAAQSPHVSGDLGRPAPVCPPGTAAVSSPASPRGVRRRPCWKQAQRAGDGPWSLFFLKFLGPSSQKRLSLVRMSW